MPDCDTTACSLSAASQFGSQDAILDQPMVDFYAGYQIGQRSNREMLTVPINDNIDFDGGIVTWIENVNGDRPYGNDLDPTLNLDVLELCFRNCERWKIVETPQRLATVRKIVDFQRRLAETGAFADPRSHIYYLPELYCAYFGRCYAALRALSPAQQEAIDPDEKLRDDPPPCHRLRLRRPAHGGDQCIRRGARAPRACQTGGRSENLRAGAVLHRALLRRGRSRPAVQGL